MAHVVLKVARSAGIVALFILAAMLGILTGVLFAYAGDLPQVTALDDYRPSTITRMNAPTFGIHLPCLSETIATPIEIQMKASLKA